MIWGCLSVISTGALHFTEGKVNGESNHINQEAESVEMTGLSSSKLSSQNFFHFVNLSLLMHMDTYFCSYLSM